jgi:hypothetical protein
MSAFFPFIFSLSFLSNLYLLIEQFILINRSFVKLLSYLRFNILIFPSSFSACVSSKSINFFPMICKLLYFFKLIILLGRFLLNNLFEDSKKFSLNED